MDNLFGYIFFAIIAFVCCSVIIANFIIKKSYKGDKVITPDQKEGLDELSGASMCAGFILAIVILYFISELTSLF